MCNIVNGVGVTRVKLLRVNKSTATKLGFVELPNIYEFSS